MKTLEQANIKNTNIPHYLCECVHCKANAIVDEADFDSFFGIPQHAADEYAWKCPVCGHVNIERDLYEKACDEEGSQNIKFELDATETKAAHEFIQKHNHKDEFKKQNKLGFSTLGQQFTYMITPGGFGPSISIKCNHCGESEDITNVDNW